MADITMKKDHKILKGDKILVSVESIIPDIIVVSFVNGYKTFQGALLDVNKSALPCGIYSPEPKMDRNDDKLATLSARYTYFQEKRCTSSLSSPSSLLSPSSSSSSLSLPLKFDSEKTIDDIPRIRKVSRPTVRLRPRQVLCNKCHAICNELNENIGVGRKRKKSDDSPKQQDNIKSNTPGPMSRKCERVGDDQLQTGKNEIGIKMDDMSSLISETSKVHSARDSNGNQMKTSEKNIEICWSKSEPRRNSAHSENSKKCHNPINRQMLISSKKNIDRSVSVSSTIGKSDSMDDVITSKKKTVAAADSTIQNAPKASQIQRTSRRKRSVGSKEDLWEENIFENIIESTSITQVTPVIKILFGSLGEGTVLKIPPKVKRSRGNNDENFTASLNHDDKPDGQLTSHENASSTEIVLHTEPVGTQIEVQKLGDKDVACAKAARKALKKAKKEARRKIASVTSDALRLNGSPRRNVMCDPLLYQRRKHKVKHKKKQKDEHEQHKIERVNDSSEENTVKCLSTINVQKIDEAACDVIPKESYTAIKEQCLKQKLSISLKRLNSNAYARYNYPVSNSSSGCKSTDISSEELSEPEQDKLLENNGVTSDDMSHFATSHPFAIQFAATSVAHCLTATGRRMNVGDVVWGKIHGFPWWPGKVLSISVSADSSSDGAQAHVAWYGSSTCSLMSCDRLSPFLETFKTRYNKKKRGPYKEAIRQAQSEAQTRVSVEPANDNVASVCEPSREVSDIS